MTLLLLVSGSVLRGKITALSVTATPGRRYLKFAAKTVTEGDAAEILFGEIGRLYMKINKFVIKL